MVSSSASRVWTTSGRPVARAARMWVRKLAVLPVARGVVVEIVEAALADGRRPWDAPASATSGAGSSRPSLPASCGWTPTAHQTSGRRSASAMPTGQPARLAAMWTMSSTPAA